MPVEIGGIQIGGSGSTASNYGDIDGIEIGRPGAATSGSTEDSGSSILPAVLGGTALVGAGLLARRPGALSSGLSKLNSLRQQLMLSGFAVPKSVLGNIGAPIIESSERGSIAPLREFFSRQTVKDWVKAYRAGEVAGPAGSITGRPGFLPSPSRLLNAGDVATRNALERAGLTAREAQRAVLQSPLTGELGKVLESPAARYVFPFRRTPFNQFTEGLRVAREWRQHPGTLGAVLGAGGLHGAITADDDLPLTVPFGIALAGRYGLPYGFAALVARGLMKDRVDLGGIPSSILPVSEYGIGQAAQAPLASFEPAALRALRSILGE